MSFSEVTHESWFGRIGSSFKGILVGGIMALVAIPLLFWNEGRAVHRARTLAEGRGIVQENVSNETVDAANEGKLVHMTGTAETEDTLSDETFSISVDHAIKLVRRVEMYQWKENKRTKTRKRTGGGRTRTTTYDYEQVWSEKRIDSSRFNQSRRSQHQNPGMPYRSETLVADEVQFGAFKLSDSQVDSLSSFERVPVDPQHVALLETPENERAFTFNNNGFYRGTDPENPQIGDLRIWFEFIGPTELSLIYQQRADTFAAYKTKDGSISLLEMGQKSADELFTHAETANTMLLWGIRLGGFMLMSLGFGMIMRPLAVLSDVIPFLGSLVGFGIAVVAMMLAGGLSLITIAIAWLFYRPVLAIALLVGAVILFLVARQYMGKRAKVIEVDRPVLMN